MHQESIIWKTINVFLERFQTPIKKQEKNSYTVNMLVVISHSLVYK